MGFLSNINHYRRVTAGMRAYMRTPFSNDPMAQLHDQLKHRQQRWLEMVRVGVFERPESVYGQLFQAACCTLGDLESALSRDGLESTLDALRQEGIYLTHDEFKGKTPIIRSGQTINTQGQSYKNPLVSGWLDTRSSGSRSSGTKSSHNTALTIHREAYWALHFEELGIRDCVSLPVRPVLPSAAGIVTVLAYARQSCTMERWFALGGSLRQSAHYRSLTNYIVALARWHGLRIPFPNHLAPGDFTPVAHALASAKRDGKRGVVQAVASIGVKVAEAALRNGWDISGSLFILSGEPVTPAKRQYVESAGAEVQIMYWISEVGPIGWSCSQSSGDDAIHLMSDSLSVAVHTQDDPLSGTQVHPLLYTTLLPTSANLLINADMGDCADPHLASCGCGYTRMGFDQKIRNIWSYAKLTGQGMTLAGTDIVELLETKLPARFGGLPGDYQLIEEEHPDGTRLILRVHPRATIDDSNAVRTAFMGELKQYYGGSLASRVWEHSQALTVVVAEPITTSTGKTPSLHLLTPNSLRGHR